MKPKKGKRYAVRALVGGLPWLSEGAGAHAASSGSRGKILARFLGWLGGKAVFRSEVGKWRFSMTKFELAKEYEVVEA
jgi:hypothetical protein